MGVWIGLAVHVPGDGPDVRVDVFEPLRLLHLLFEDASVDGRQGLNMDKEVSSRGEPLGAVFGEATPWDDVMEVRMVLELSAPGMEDAGKTGQVGADEALILSEAFDGRCRRLEHGRVGDALMWPDEGSEGLRDGEGDEEVRCGKLFFKLVV